MPRGLILSVYRPADLPDCTNGGLTSQHDRIIVVGTRRHSDEEWQPFGEELHLPDWGQDLPQFILVESAVPGVYEPNLVPVEYIEKGSNTKEYAGPMFGGNFAGTSDSRWTELSRTVFGHSQQQVVPVHDRVESWAMYNALSSD